MINADTIFRSQKLSFMELTVDSNPLIPINYSLLNDTNETIQELPKAILKLTDVMKNQGSYMGGGRR